MSLPNLTVPFNTIYPQSFEIEAEDDATSVSFIMIKPDDSTVTLKSTPFEMIDGKKIADLTLTPTMTSQTSPTNKYKLLLNYAEGSIRLPEPGDDCDSGDCDLPELNFCDIPA